jgi:hypothetical protein
MWRPWSKYKPFVGRADVSITSSCHSSPEGRSAGLTRLMAVRLRLQLRLLLSNSPMRDRSRAGRLYRPRYHDRQTAPAPRLIGSWPQPQKKEIAPAPRELAGLDSRALPQGNRVNVAEAGLSPRVMTGRASTPGHPRLCSDRCKKSWVAGLNPAMTQRTGLNPAMTRRKSLHPIALCLTTPVVPVRPALPYASAPPERSEVLR